MQGRHLPVLVVAVFVVVMLAPAADSAPGKKSADAISGSWHKIPGGAELNLKNTGSTTILYDRGLTDTQTLTDASQDGKPCRVSSLTFNCGPFSVAPGQSFKIVLHSTSAARLAERRDEAGVIQVWISSDGVIDTGPFRISYDPQSPCYCTGMNLGAKTLGPSGLSVEWRMYCNGGNGSCKGAFRVAVPKGLVLKGGATGFLQCKGNCTSNGWGNGGGSGVATFRFKATKDVPSPLSIAKRKGKKFEFRVTETCVGQNGIIEPVNPAETFTFVYDKKGRLDPKKSNLEGDLKPRTGSGG